MERRTKIKLFEHWLEHPEDMGDIPRHMQELVTTNDIFALKKELGWKPFTKGNVNKLLNKAKYTEFGSRGGFQFKRKGNPYIALIVVALIIIPSILNSVFVAGRNPFMAFPAYMLIGFIIALVVILNVINAAKKKGEGRRRESHASAR